MTLADLDLNPFLVGTVLGLFLLLVFLWAFQYLAKHIQSFTRPCKFCKSRMHKDAIVCPQCGRDQVLTP